MQSLISIWSWVVAHQGIVAGATVGLLDLLMAVCPGLAGNGILHEILVISQKKQTPPSS